MSTNYFWGNDENLSEEMLSESATPAKVKAVEHLHDNMERSSFKSDSSSKTIRDQKLDNRWSSGEKKRNTFRKFGKLINSDETNLSQISPENPPFCDDFSSASTYWQSSLRSDISKLLKLSANMKKKKKSSFASDQLKRDSIPQPREFNLFGHLSEQEPEPEMKDSFSFGMR